MPWIVEGCNEPEFVRWSIDVPQPYTEADAHAFLDVAEQSAREGTRAVFAIEEAETGTPLGVVDLQLRRHGDAAHASVGYWLRAEARGRGAATRGLRLAARHAFEERGIERLSLTTAPDNAASQRVAERAGFTREGLLRAYLPLPSGRRRDSVSYSLLPGDLGA